MATQMLRLCLAMLALVALAAALPDSADTAPLPGPGLSYGGIPYGSMSGNVAEFFKRQATSAGRSQHLAAHPELDFAPIEQYLR